MKVTRPISHDRNSKRIRESSYNRYFNDGENPTNDKDDHNCNRTHSLQKCRDNSFLSNYNQSLIGLSQSFVNTGHGPLTAKNQNDRKMERQSHSQFINANSYASR